ncbi:MAG: hypothetical protein ACI9JM_001815 [Halioglobus sp.]|jgi:hypothetical protein
MDFDSYAIDNTASSRHISQIDPYVAGTEDIIFNGAGIDTTTGFTEFMNVRLSFLDLFDNVSELTRALDITQLSSSEFTYRLADTQYPMSEFRGSIDTLSVSVVNLPMSPLLVLPGLALIMARRTKR